MSIVQFVLRLRQFLQETTLHKANGRPFLIREHGEDKMKGTFRTGGRNVKQASFLFQVAFPINCPLVWKQAVGQSNYEDMWKLQPLGLVNGGQA